MMCADVVDRLPKCWQGLFRALRCPLSLDSFQVAEQWLQQKYYSKFENVPQWEFLLSGLAQTEPQHRADTLSLKPLFCLLPCHLQIKLLTLIFHHRRQICMSSLEAFLGAIRTYLDGGWTQTLYDMLTHFTEQYKHETGTGITLGNHNFSLVNRALTKQVYETLSTADIISPLQTSVDVAITDTNARVSKDKVTPDGTEEEIFELFDDKIAEAALQDDVIIIQDDDSLMDSPPSKKVKHNESSMDSPPSKTVTHDEDGSMDSPPSKKVKHNECSMDSPPLKAVKHVIESVRDTTEASEVKQIVLDKAEWLRELCQSPSVPDLESSELSFLSTLPATMMKSLCDAANISSLPDESLVSAFELLTQMKHVVSHSSCVAFISRCFLPKFIGLDHTASKTLTDVFMNLGQTFPKHLIDSLTADGQMSNLTSFQSDILCRLCKESFNDECQAYMLRKLLSSSSVLNEHGVVMVSCLLERLDDLDETTTSVVFHCISKSAHNLCDSLKFGKLIFTFVNKYANTWSAAQLSLLFQVTDSHKTFMKKSVLAALRRISK